MTDKKERNNAISYIRCISMIMIILCHFFQYYDNELAWWFNVGVQVFFVVSGFLYGGKDISDFIAFICKQFRKILIPYYSFLVCAGILYVLFAADKLSLIAVVKAVFCAGTVEGLGHLWFVGYILFCYLITPYLFWIKKKTKALSIGKMIITHITLLLLMVILGVLFDSYFNPSRVCCYVIGYFMSIYHQKYGIKAEKILLLLFALITVPINILRFYIKYVCVLPEGSLFAKLFSFLEGYMHLCLGVFVFLILFVVLEHVKGNKLIKITDKYSYYVYICHQLFILSPFSLMAITPFIPLNWIIVTVAIIGSSILLYLMSQVIDKKLSKLGGNA